jgi:hypothetical protein
MKSTAGNSSVFVLPEFFFEELLPLVPFNGRDCGHMGREASNRFVFGTGGRIRQSPRKIDFSGLEL